MKQYVIGLDVDSTIVTHAYPAMGEDLGAVPWLLRVVDRFPQVCLMLNTMRSGPSLELAVQWLHDRGVPVWAANRHPTQHEWTESPKPYAHLYLDDRALGVPLRKDRCVDWSVFGPMLLEHLENELGYMDAEK